MARLGTHKRHSYKESSYKAREKETTRNDSSQKSSSSNEFPLDHDGEHGAPVRSCDGCFCVKEAIEWRRQRRDGARIQIDMIRIRKQMLRICLIRQIVVAVYLPEGVCILLNLSCVGRSLLIQNRRNQYVHNNNLKFSLPSSRTLLWPHR